MLDSPLLYSGRQRRLRATVFALPSGHSELRSIYLCSSLIPWYPAIKFSHKFITRSPTKWLYQEKQYFWMFRTYLWTMNTCSRVFITEAYSTKIWFFLFILFIYFAIAVVSSEQCWVVGVATFLGSILASSYTAESEGLQMKQWWIQYIKKVQRKIGGTV